MGTQTRPGPFRRRTNVRRIGIAGLVIVCLALFTLYFRESATGPLHGIQDATGAAVAPLQQGASRAVAPLQDGWNWLSETRDARNRAADLEAENAELRSQIIAAQSAAERAQSEAGLASAGSAFTADYDRLVADVIGLSPTNWYSTGKLSVGRDDGAVVNSPVIAPAEDGSALVGVITASQGGSSVVQFITDSRTRVGASVLGAGNPPGILRATTSGQLSLDGVPREFAVEEGQVAVTAGFSDIPLPSVYPPGIPIGQVSGVGGQEADIEQTIQVSPFVDPRTLRTVVVLAPASPKAKRRATG